MILKKSRLITVVAEKNALKPVYVYVDKFLNQPNDIHIESVVDIP